MNTLLTTFLDFLWPMQCASCGTEARSFLCHACRAKVKVHPMTACCPICGKVMMREEAAGKIPEPCPQCRKHKPHFDKACSAAEFSGPIHDLIIQFKYNNGMWLVKDLTDLLEGAFIAKFASEKIHTVCPVPLFHAKFRKRGYNQADLLGRELARRLSLNYEPDVLRRVRPTTTQTAMNARDRRKNMENAFVSPPEQRPFVFGRGFLLIDDVMTTGATVSECAAALKAGGAASVFVLSVARD